MIKRNFMRVQFWLGGGTKFKTEGSPVAAVFDCIKAMTFEQRQELLNKLDNADYKLVNRNNMP